MERTFLADWKRPTSSDGLHICRTREADNKVLQKDTNNIMITKKSKPHNFFFQQAEQLTLKSPKGPKKP